MGLSVLFNSTDFITKGLNLIHDRLVQTKQQILTRMDNSPTLSHFHKLLKSLIPCFHLFLKKKSFRPMAGHMYPLVESV